ncbi:YihY/virulence factor BrkB family protein [Candidatus Binatus sp.]|uniref:YihY/virulence factor BrkB family protein n=1 Tax=Candidatus Binatus sp. TaxID=2811406 RepID=UPI003C98C962
MSSEIASNKLLDRSKALTAAKNFLQQVFRDFSKDECPSMAAALAYATLFSLPSLLLIVIYIAGLVLGPQAASGQIESKLSGAMGPQAAAQIQTMVSNVAQNHAGGLIATVAGFVGLILSATSVLLQLQLCLNKAWKVTAVGSGWKSFAMQRVRSILLLIGAGILAMVSVVAGSAISALAHMIPFPGAAHAGEILTSLIMFALVFAAILKVMPDVHLRWSDVWVGGLFIAVLFVVGKFLIGLYLGHASKASAYGAAGSLAVILLWTYYSALIFLLGVEFTQVWVRSRGQEAPPKPGAVRREPLPSS